MGYTSDGSALLGVPPPGLVNWYPRGSNTFSLRALTGETLLDTSTGQKQQVIVAVLDSALGGETATTMTVTLKAEQQSARDYRQYTYRREGGFSAINGTEDGAGKKVLRYNITGINPDVVEVYVNGVKRNRGTGANDFQLYDGTMASQAPPNTVLFNSIVLGSVTQVDVIVTKAAGENIITAQFTRAASDEARIGTGAWEGVDKVSSFAFPGQTASLFYLDFNEVAGFPSDVKLRIDDSSAITVGVTQVPADSVFILLSTEGLSTTIDTVHSRVVYLSSISTDTQFLISRQVDGVRRLFVTEEALSDVFPPLSKTLFRSPELVRTGLTGTTGNAIIDSRLIIGPDK